MARDVYRGQFDNVADLKEALLYELDNIEDKTVRNLIASIPKSVWECYQKRGNATRC